VAQDFYDPLQPFDYMVDKLDDNKAALGIRYIAENDERLRPLYPAILVTLENLERDYHATGQFLLTFHIDVWVFHAELTVKKAVRSRKDIELATAIRKLIHNDRSMGGHIVHGWVDGEFPGITARVIGENVNTIVTTRLTWQGVNRAPFEAS
jgi:hypothetical protein